MNLQLISPLTVRVFGGAWNRIVAGESPKDTPDSGLSSPEHVLWTTFAKLLMVEAYPMAYAPGELGEIPAPASFKVPSLLPKRDDVSSQKPAPRTPRTSDVSTRGNDLSPIAEDRANGPRHGIEFSPGHQSYLSQTYVAESQTDHGNISGTTMLQTDDSDHETDEPDPHLLLDTLPDLLNASTKALDLLAPPGISYANVAKHFQTAKFSVRYNRAKVTFETQKKCIVKSNFIPIERSVAALSSIKKLDWQSEGLYQKANLAQLALDLVNPRLTASTAAADDSFPAAFMASRSFEAAGSSAGDDCRRETFQMGLELRTQRFISSLLSGSPSEFSEPEDLLADVFYNPSLSSVNTELKGWAMDGLEDEDEQLPEEFHETAQERISLIRKTLAQGGSLESKFPWSAFIVSIANWIRKRVNDIDQLLSSQMSVEDAIKILQAELDRRSSFGPGNPLEPILDSTLGEVEPPVEQSTTPERVVETKQADKEDPATVSSPTNRSHRRFRGRGALQRVLAVGPVQDAPSIPNQATTEEITEEPQAPTSPTRRPRRRFQGKGALRRVLAIGITDNAHSSSNILATTENKAQTLHDGEETTESRPVPAQGSLLDGGSPPPPSQNSPPRLTPAVSIQESPQKTRSSNRPEELPPLSLAELWQLSEEGNKVRKSKQKSKARAAFIDRQADARRVSPIRFTPSPSDNASTRPSPQKRGAEAMDPDSNESGGGDDDDEDEDLFEIDNRPIKKRRVLNIPAPPRPTPASVSRTVGTSDSQAATRTRSPSATAPPQQRFERVSVEPQPGFKWAPRRAWSLEEEACLRKYIEECGGPSWSEIKKRDGMAENILFKRTQVQIKDKGAQMHYDDLMAGRPLTVAMARVPIRKVMRDRLIKEGKMEA
ncbi:hypothetical protein MGYG_05483 [Nannizzia gypsea CBS 118893]|uniref:Myb-like domain-containing protein n=1 Tax=Arthroderma gypseum (strain ATCC MYA-4604 / CBS 118893) TaxID=535722 RepID=E4UW42_ARTGP|nr:hypothetical protein MGYG_05483 [Nannizzia gypsea CBS 118893]EFR02490.1 hypothetical protein MGYG_05483 [Nannizzia gypsea CBS 118893]